MSDHPLTIPIDRTGRILAGPKYVGWNVKVESDGGNSGGLLILIWNGEQAWDDWVQSAADLPVYFSESWTVEWKPIA